MDYQPLDANRGEIRLLKLAPASEHSDGQPLTCTLEYTDLYQPLFFVALSYVWGDPDDTVPLLVDGHIFAATRNLANALRNLQQRGLTTVWADAICINQKDPIERSQQVLRIGKIYEKAKSTQAWLPAKDANAEGSSFNRQERLSIQDLSHMRMEDRGYLGRLFRHEYWHRVWIIQELALSHNVELLHDGHIWQLNDIYQLLGKWGTYSTSITAVPDGLARLHATRLQGICTKVAKFEPISLMEAMVVSRGCKASDTRDHVYGLLGLVHGANRYVSVPSYSITTRQLCLDLTDAYIRISNSLDILPMLASSDNQSVYPSWLPQWCDMRSPTSIASWYYIEADSPGITRPQDMQNVWKFEGRCFPKWSATKAVPYYHISDDTRTLRVRMGFLGRITACTTSWTETSANLEPPDYPPVNLQPSYVFRALLFLFSLPELYSAGDGRRRSANWHTVRAFRSLHLKGLQYRSLQQQHPMLHEWFARNSLFEINGMSMPGCMRARTYGVFEFYTAAGPNPLPEWAEPEPQQKLSTSECLDIIICSPLYLFLGLFWFLVSKVFILVRHCCYLEPKARCYPPGQNFCRRLETILRLDMRLAQGGFGLGWADRKARVGDTIALIPGCSVPVVLRTRTEGGWILIGKSIVYGAMNGEHETAAASSWPEIEIH